MNVILGIGMLLNTTAIILTTIAVISVNSNYSEVKREVNKIQKRLEQLEIHTDSSDDQCSRAYYH